MSSEKNTPKPKPNLKHMNREESLVAAVPKDAFKAMFYLFAGKPDSKVKLLKRKILVQFNDVKDLNKKIFDKLKLHQVDQCVATAIIKFDKEETMEFGTWAEFEAFDWKIPYETQEVTLRWDFMIKLNSFAAPQRHTLTVRLATAPKPKDMLQIIMSQDPDDSDLDGKLGLCVVRVDFISHRLADELIEVVEEWNLSLCQPDTACSWFSCLERFDRWIARGVHYSVPVFFTCLTISLLSFWFPSISAAEVVKKTDLILFGRWLILTAVGLYLVTKFSHELASRCYHSVNQYGAFIPFNFTRGDENRAAKLRIKNRATIGSFFIHAGCALVLNVIAGIFTWWLLPGN